MGCVVERRRYGDVLQLIHGHWCVCTFTSALKLEELIEYLDSKSCVPAILRRLLRIELEKKMPNLTWHRKVIGY